MAVRIRTGDGERQHDQVSGLDYLRPSNETLRPDGDLLYLFRPVVKKLIPCVLAFMALLAGVVRAQTIAAHRACRNRNRRQPPNANRVVRANNIPIHLSSANGTYSVSVLPSALFFR